MMVLSVSTGPTGWGKTQVFTRYVIPIVLSRPQSYHPMCPSRFNLIIVLDPATDRCPRGQYGGKPFASWSAFLRSGDKRRLNSILVQPNIDLVEEVCAVALRARNTLVIVDELDMGVPAGGDNNLPPSLNEMCQAGRHKGCAIMGSVRRMGKLHITARNNVQWAYLGHMREDSDIKAACSMMEISRREYDALPKKKEGEFIEWRVGGEINLTSFKNGQRRVLTGG